MMYWDGNTVVIDGRHTALSDPDVQAALAAGGEILSTRPPDSSAATLEMLAGARRWEIETGGITLPGGIVVATDAVAQSKIDAALAAFERGALSGTIAFKAAGGFVDLDQAGLTAVYAAVVAHVQACYAAESAVVNEIDAGTITDAAGVESSPHWPAV